MTKSESTGTQVMGLMGKGVERVWGLRVKKKGGVGELTPPAEVLPFDRNEVNMGVISSCVETHSGKQTRWEWVKATHRFSLSQEDNGS